MDAPACQNVTPRRSVGAALANRQFDCPPGVECGHGPECTLETCDLAGCADAEVCQDISDKKRSLESDLVARQFGSGPVCTSGTCDLAGCVDAPVCQDNVVEKRSADSNIVPPVCDICYVDDNGVTVCGCATPSG